MFFPWISLLLSVFCLFCCVISFSHSRSLFFFFYSSFLPFRFAFRFQFFSVTLRSALPCPPFSLRAISCISGSPDNEAEVHEKTLSAAVHNAYIHQLADAYLVIGRLSLLHFSFPLSFGLVLLSLCSISLSLSLCR